MDMIIETISKFFSIQTIFFQVLGYQMSILEFVGTIFTLWSVWLVTKNKILNWPIGIVGSVLFAFLFFQIRLYADFGEQIYYTVMGFYGWWVWRTSKNHNNKDLPITINTKSQNTIYLTIIAAGTLCSWYFLSNIHIYLPVYFIEKASFPFLDSLTTIISFIATFLLARKKLESWYLWIFVDVVGIGLYITRGVIFVGILYCIFLVLAIKGLSNWTKLYKNSAI